MVKFLAMLAVIGISLLNTYLTLTLGWGLEVRSWPALILFGIVGVALTHTLGRAVLDHKD